MVEINLDIRACLLQGGSSPDVGSRHPVKHRGEQLILKEPSSCNAGREFFCAILPTQAWIAMILNGSLGISRPARCNYGVIRRQMYVEINPDIGACLLQGVSPPDMGSHHSVKHRGGQLIPREPKYLHPGTCPFVHIQSVPNTRPRSAHAPTGTHCACSARARDRRRRGLWL
jgi:hypothetical protein